MFNGINCKGVKDCSYFIRNFFYLKSKIMTDKLDLNKIKLNHNDKSMVQLRDINNKRKNYLEWDDYFMAIAFLAAMRSKDPCTQVGACIVNENKKIVGIGYNGMPIGCSDDEFPWSKENKDEFETKYLYVCHAELNAIVNKNTENIQNCTLYVGLFPCNECAKVIIQSGIKKVYYISDKHAYKHTTLASKRMFNAAKVEYRQYKPVNKKIVIDFNEIDWNEITQLPPKSLADKKY